MDDIMLMVIVSYLALILISIFRDSRLITPLNIYIVFSSIYVLFPYYYLLNDVQLVSIDLPHLNIQYSKIISYTVVVINVLFLVLQCMSPKFLNYRLGHRPLSNRKIYLYLFIFSYPFVLSLVYFYSWPEFGEGFSRWHSFSAFGKLLLLVLFSILSYSKYKHVLFIMVLVVCVVDSARTHLFIAIFIYLLSLEITFRSCLKYLPHFSLMIFIFLYVTLSRNSVEIRLEYFFWPFFSEGIFGSYGVYQTLELIANDYSCSPLDYFLDNALLVVYKFFHNGGCVLSVVDDSLYYNILNNKLYPFGGHFFLSELYLYFGFGAALFFCIIKISYVRFSRLVPYELVPIYISSTFLIIKSPLFVLLKFILSIFVIYLIVSFVAKIFGPKESKYE